MGKKGLNSVWAAGQCVLLLLLAILIGGCDGGNRSAPLTIQGWVSAESPISAASLGIYNLQGDPIFQEEEAVTGDLGSFMISVAGLPADFRVVASSGSQGEQPFLAELSADYRDFDPENDIVYINAVTTMVSAYFDRHPEFTLEEARARVKRFLEIPDWVDIGSDLHASTTDFDHGLFLAEAENNGGIATYVDQLIVEMDEGDPAVTHPFPGQGGIGGGGAGEFVARSLAQGAISYVGGQCLGWGLREIGLSFGGDGNSEAIKEAIREMQQQLESISQQVGALANRVDAISEQLRGIQRSIDQVNYDTRVGQMSELIGDILTIREALTLFVSEPPTSPAALARKRNDIIEKIRTKLIGKENIIHYQLTGLASQTPLLKIWSQIVKNKKRFLSKSDHTSVDTHFRYFDMLQIWLMQLLVEYYHATAGEGEDISDKILEVTNNYQVHLTAQSAYIKPPIPDNIYIYNNPNNPEYSLMIYLPDNEYSAMCYPWRADYPDPGAAPWLVTVTNEPPGGLMCGSIQYWHNPDYNPDLWIPLGDTWYLGISFSGGMTAQPMVLMGRLWAMNDSRFLGFNDWRFPAVGQVQDMFRGWSGTPGDFAGSQGLTPMRRDHFIITSDLTSYELWQRWNYDWRHHQYNDVPPSLSQESVSFYATTDGGIGQRNWYGGPDQNVLQLMPIRILSPGEERYFW